MGLGWFGYVLVYVNFPSSRGSNWEVSLFELHMYSVVSSVRLPYVTRWVRCEGLDQSPSSSRSSFAGSLAASIQRSLQGRFHDFVLCHEIRLLFFH